MALSAGRKVPKMFLGQFKHLIKASNRQLVSRRRLCRVAGDNLSVLQRQRLAIWSSRTLVHDAKTAESTDPELSMNNKVFSEFVYHLVENQALIPHFHKLLTTKVGDYDLR